MKPKRYVVQFAQIRTWQIMIEARDEDEAEDRALRMSPEWLEETGIIIGEERDIDMVDEWPDQSDTAS